MLNILEACTEYDINLNLVDNTIKKQLLDEFRLPEDTESIVLTGEDITIYNIPDEAVNYDSAEFDSDTAENLLKEMIGNYPYYLVYMCNCTWNHGSRYMFTKSILKTVARDYDISLCLEKEHQGKAIVCIESSHDVPTGSRTIIIGISNKQHTELSNASEDYVEKFAISFL